MEDEKDTEKEKKKFIYFAKVETNGKTKLVDVVSNISGQLLGEIKWCGPLRQYAFYPEPKMWFNNSSLRIIEAYVTNLNTAQKIRTIN